MVHRDMTAKIIESIRNVDKINKMCGGSFVDTTSPEGIDFIYNMAAQNVRLDWVGDVTIEKSDIISGRLFGEDVNNVMNVGAGGSGGY